MGNNETYRATGCGMTIALFGVLIVSMLPMFVVISMLPKDINGAVGFGAMVAGALPGTIVVIVFINRMIRRRAQRILAELERAGFTCWLDPTAEQQSQAVTTIGRLAMLEQSPEYIRWVARKSTPAGESVVLQHSFVTGSGRTANEHVAIVAAVPMPADLTTGVWLRRSGFLLRRADQQQGVQDIQVGDKWLDKNFRIQAHDPAEPARLLTRTALRELIASGPKAESWAITPTHAMCIFRGHTSPRGVSVMLRRAQRMVDRVRGVN